MGLLFIIPMVILLVLGIVLTARARAEHGRAATFGMVGCIVLLLGAILQGAWQVILPSIVQSGGFAIFGVVNAVVGFVFVVVDLVGTGFLIGGVVARRNPPQAPQYPQAPQGWQQQPPPGQWPSR
ncbi:hypothetical protein [Nonomuraea sp. bgisy101]|uniref:hypothetical protein n=1 Tax=Nonomuraea sp. bgisy101 TaxID=3413784 RepID=UPI003D73B847